MRRDSIYKSYQPAVAPGQGNGNRCYWFAFHSNKLLINIDNNQARIPFSNSLEEIKVSPIRTQYLGEFRGQPCYSAEVSPETVAPEGTSFLDLRSLYEALDEDVFLVAGKAIQIVSWDQTHQYCGRCGTKTETISYERAKRCPACGLTNYPRISPAVIIAVFKGDKILLSRNVAFKGKIRSLIAGFVEPGETLEECARREILEEVGLQVKNLRYFGSQPWPFPNSLMIGFTAEYESGEIVVNMKEISESAWYGAQDLPDLPAKISIAREMIDWFTENKSGCSQDSVT
jgi:NAD+ diphosphatase